MTSKQEKVFWNGAEVGVVTEPHVDNFDYYGNWEPIKDRAFYEEFINAVDEEGGAQVSIGGLDSSLQGTVEIEPEEEIEIKIRV